MFGLSIYVSRRDRGLGPRLTIMGTIALIVKCSERLNRIAARNWASFATQNYFDGRGVFMSIMVCTPLLLDSLIMLLLFLREASQLLIKFKTVQLKEQIRKKKESNPTSRATKESNKRAKNHKTDVKKED
jgi:transmembrane protein 18